MNAPELRKASFRGVSFEVTNSTFKIGRRTQTFEYPQGDTPFTEDLGRSKRTVTVTAYVVGLDYIVRMKKLIAACEKKGSGRLIHPWLGTMEVTVTDISSPTFDSNRMATISLTFVESGKLEFPNSVVDGGERCLNAANALFNNSINEFIEESDTLKKAQEFVKETVVDGLNEIINDDVIKKIGQGWDLADGLVDLANDAITLVSGAPKSLAERVVDVLGLHRFVSTAHAWSDVANRFSLLAKEESLNQASSEVVQTSGTTGEQIEKANSAIQSLLREVSIANAVIAASEVGTDNDRVNESAPVETHPYDDLIAVRDNILEAIDAEMLKTQDDAVYETLCVARSAVYEAITQRAENQARLLTYTPSTVMPALVLAYDYYGDATRELEITGRNKVRHSGFVPAIPLKLLNE